MGRRRSSRSSGGTISVLTTQHKSMPVAAMNPKSRNARNSGHEERQVRGRRGDRGDHRGLPRFTHGGPERKDDGDSPAALLEIARLIQDPHVDAVAGDDADEEARRDVEVPDHKLRDPERPDQSDADRDPHHEERPQAHEVKEHGRKDQDDAGRPDAQKIVTDAVVLDEPGRHVAGVADAHVAELGPRRPYLVHGGMHARERRPGLREVAAGDGRARHDHEARPVLSLVVPVGVVVAARLVLLFPEPLLDVLDRDRRPGVVEQLARLLGHLVVPSVEDVVVELLKLFFVEEKAGAWGQESARGLRPVVGARHDVRAEGEELRDEGIAHRAEGRAVRAFEEDEHRLGAGRPRLDATELLDARLVLRQEGVVAGLELEPEREEREDGGYGSHEKERNPGTPDLQLAQTLDEVLHPGAPPCVAKEGLFRKDRARAASVRRSHV